MKEQHSSQASLVQCVISKAGSDKQSIGSDKIGAFQVHESIASPCMAGSLLISDSVDFMNTYPIQGGENISMELKTTFDEKPIKYEFVIAGIKERTIKNKIQTYVIKLISPEALINEGTRVMDPLTGNSEAIVAKLLGKPYLNSVKELFSEPSRFEIRMNPARNRPFDIIANLLRKSVSSKTNYRGVTNENTTETAQQIKGSAGFFFWETRRGYNFFSIDALCDETGGKYAAPMLDDLRKSNANRGEDLFNKDNSTWGPYIEIEANTDVSGDQRFLIENATFTSEINLMSSLRQGKYSSLMVFFNSSTGQYEEYVYKIKDSYDNMSHLGGQESVSLIPANQIELSDFPTRIMSMMLDHEAWYNEPGIADPEDEKATDPNKFADWQKYYAAQGAARTQMLKNQECTIRIPGNPLICAGDRVDIRITSKLADALKKKQPFDEESSGVYLIKETTQTYTFVNSDNGTLKTTLRLFRDSYGMKDIPSKRGNK